MKLGLGFLGLLAVVVGVLGGGCLGPSFTANGVGAGTTTTTATGGSGTGGGAPNCTPACPGDATCSNGVCACNNTAKTPCDLKCVLTQTDPANCGTCGHACGSTEQCKAGACVATGCPSGQIQCPPGSGTCVTQSNTQCGSTCAKCTAPENTCTSGVCSCPGSQTLCGTGTAAACVNTQNDNANCGTCGKACTNGQTCQGGQCACPGGADECVPGWCSNVDPDNCGNCGKQCPLGATCSNGNCVQCTGSLSCATPDPGVCTATNANNSGLVCGTCGTECGHLQRCALGACSCRPGLTECATGCVDTKVDLLNCGGCAMPCAGKCINGTCNVASTTCPASATDCNGACVPTLQLQFDPVHCGASCTTCAPDELCAAGVCKQYFTSPSCTSGCPCAACGSGHKCCGGAGGTQPFCVAGTACPG